MELSFGPFFTCFIITFFLIGYLYIIIRWYPAFSERTMKFSLVATLIILIRMAVPVNFPFTYTIFSYQILPNIIAFATIPIIGNSISIIDMALVAWFFVATILLVKLLIQYIRLHRYLSLYYMKDHSKWNHLFTLIDRHCNKQFQIALIPEPISPAITGFLKPTLILPDIEGISNEELEYICLHELAHYKQHHLWLGLLMEIVCRIHWWNPFVQHMKKEFALFLELSNDFFLIQSSQYFNITDYANLIIKTAKRTRSSKQSVPCNLMNFVIDNSSILTTRINLILNSKDAALQKNRFLTAMCQGIVCLAVLFSLFLVFDPSFIKIDMEKQADGKIAEEEGYLITEENAYMIDTGNGYSLYVDGNHFIDFANMNAIPEELKNIPVYKKGEKMDLP